ncbi:MAG: AAA family ATPase [Ruminococcus sp.]|nr:AAA family ATPase [Ruminococcus sp.]
MGKLEKIQGEVDSIVFKSEDTGFCVLMLNMDNDLITVVGDMGDVEEGEELVLTGEFTHHRKFGEQFKVSIFERKLPSTAAAIQRYLSSGAITGIGPILARRLVKEFGDKTLEVIENDHEKLAQIEGLTKKKADKIHKEFKTTFAVRSLLVYLSGFEVPTSYSIRAFKRWGDGAQQLITANPYLLCGDGIELAFSKADEIARKQGMELSNECRIKAGISCILRKNGDNGHTCLPLDKLRQMAVKFLQIDEEAFDRVLQQEVEEENLFIYKKQQRPFVMLREYYRAEDYIARRLALMQSISYDNQIDFSEVIDLEEEQNDITYERIQRQAINLALSKGFLVLTGGPGTGKTTTLNAIISLYQQQGMEVMIAAPTGRAAKRISDLTGCDAKTIHRLLEVQYRSDGTLTFAHDENDLLDCDALIIDEMSMVDSCLFEALLRAISVTCKLVLVGDSDQLR